jgi:hypothetical protein
MELFLKFADQIIGILTTYWWAIHSMSTSPLVGYGLTQRYKGYRKSKGKPKRDDFFIMNLAGAITGILTFGFWYKYESDLTAAIFMGLIIGVLQPWIVKKILNKVKDKDPELYEEMKHGTDPQTVMIPWKKKVFIDSTGQHHIDTNDGKTVVVKK